LQCVAVCCSALQCVAVCCSVLQCVAVCCSVLQCIAVCYSVLQRVTACCSVLQRVAFRLHIYVAHYQKSSVVVEKILEIFNSAGTKNRKPPGRNDFNPVFSKNIMVCICCFFYFCLSGPIPLEIHKSRTVLQCVAVSYSVL